MRRTKSEEADESFFVSMTDIMVGLLFIFIMIIMYFALQTRIDQAENERLVGIIEEAGGIETYANLDGYQSLILAQRSQLLRWIGSLLNDQGISGIELIEESGVMRLPEGILFNSGEYEFDKTSEAYRVATTLAEALAQILPCSVFNQIGEPLVDPEACRISRYHNRNFAYVQGIYIEGHTDDDEIDEEVGLSGDPNLTNNLKLSARRSTNTFDSITSVSPEILTYHGPVVEGERLRFEPVLASSAYGESRPIASNESEEGKKANRRIDLRVEMFLPPSVNAAQTFLSSLNKNLEDIVL